MKNVLYIFFTLVCFTQFSFAQDILDGAYKKDIRDGSNERLIQPYQHVREADVMWSTKIERVIDLREKMNQVFYYPIRPINDRKNLIDVLIDAIKEGTITAYDARQGDEFKSPFSATEAQNIGLMVLGIPQSYTLPQIDPDTGEEIIIIVENNFDDFKHNVKKYRIKEEWFFDKQRSVMEVRIIGICPIIDKYNEDGDALLGEVDLFWVYYPEARKVFSKAEVFNHRKNDAARLTFDDIFHKRFFSSRIVKESNKYDRSIDQYKQGLDALLESEKIKEEIFNLEHDLWEY